MASRNNEKKSTSRRNMLQQFADSDHPNDSVWTEPKQPVVQTTCVEENQAEQPEVLRQRNRHCTVLEAELDDYEYENEPRYFNNEVDDGNCSENGSTTNSYDDLEEQQEEFDEQEQKPLPMQEFPAVLTAFRTGLDRLETSLIEYYFTRTDEVYSLYFRVSVLNEDDVYKFDWSINDGLVTFLHPTLSKEYAVKLDYSSAIGRDANRIVKLLVEKEAKLLLSK